MLEVSDIYNFYGLTMIDEKSLDEENCKLYEFYLNEIKSAYVFSLKKRIKEEAGYLGLDIEGTSLEALLGNMKSKLDEEIIKQSRKMAALGAGFDLMSLVKSQHATKPKGMENAADGFRSKQGKSRTAFGGEPWAKISEAFIAIERAVSPKSIILAIDLLNSLQHNTCHVLFDVTGTRGGGGQDHNAVKQVLDEKFKAKHPREFSSKMSSEMKSFLESLGAL